MKLENVFKLFLAVIVCEAAGIAGAFFTSPAVSSSWYVSLEKPSFQLPSWIFPPVWIMLYALMGEAVFLVGSSYAKNTDGQTQKRVKIALDIFGGQLALNTFWSIVFFGLKSPGWAFVDIIALWLAILCTILAFYKISRPAAYLLLPYIIWTSFAAYLNYSIWMLN